MSQRPKLSFFERRAIVPRQEFIDAAPYDVPTDENTPNLDNVQGDVYFMFPKKWENFLFFKITDTTQFQKDLAIYAPRITSSRQTAKDLLDVQKCGGGDKDIVSTSIAFARAGLNVLNITQKLGDPHFDKGSLVLEKKELGDMAQYDEVFDGNAKTHGVIWLTAREQQTCQDKMKEIRDMFANSITVEQTYEGRVRVGDGEHFGWRDGISQPALDCKWNEPKPSQRVVKPGVIIMGYPEDPVRDDPAQLGHYINKNWPSIPAQPENGIQLTTEQRKLLFGARLVGRFKSGVPLALCPYIEDPQFPERDYNKFDHSESHGRCPFAAHTRKTAPRNLQPIVSKELLDASVIVRSSIPYGDDVTDEERTKWKTLTEEQKESAVCNRGLLFVCYQSSIHNGYYRQTTGFANNDFFPTTGLALKYIGQDPIIGGPRPVCHGQANISQEGQVTLQLINPVGVKFKVTGVAEEVDTSATAFEEKFFATSRGGDYYFVPSIGTVREWADTS